MCWLQLWPLTFQNQKLNLENRVLREKTSDLLTENEELRQRLGLDTLEGEKVNWKSHHELNHLRVGVGASEGIAVVWGDIYTAHLQWSCFDTSFLVMFWSLMNLSLLPLSPGTGSGVGVRCELRGFGDRVFWVRSTQAMCASAAGAGPAVLKSEEFAMDTGSPGSSDAEVRLQQKTPSFIKINK